jgi:hypothetical protein
MLHVIKSLVGEKMLNLPKVLYTKNLEKLKSRYKEGIAITNISNNVYL